VRSLVCSAASARTTLVVVLPRTCPQLTRLQRGSLRGTIAFTVAPLSHHSSATHKAMHARRRYEDLAQPNLADNQTALHSKSAKNPKVCITLLHMPQLLAACYASAYFFYTPDCARRARGRKTARTVRRRRMRRRRSRQKSWKAPLPVTPRYAARDEILFFVVWLYRTKKVWICVCVTRPGRKRN
jgi:hypothetical protein